MSDVSRKYDSDGGSKKSAGSRHGDKLDTSAPVQQVPSGPQITSDHPLSGILYIVVVISSVGWLFVISGSFDSKDGPDPLAMIAAAIISTLGLLMVISVLNMLHRILAHMRWFAEYISAADQEYAKPMVRSVDDGKLLEKMSIGIDDLNTGISECCHELRQLNSRKSAQSVRSARSGQDGGGQDRRK